MTVHMPPHDREILAALAQTNFFAFTWRAYQTLHPGEDRPFIPNWHIEAMCHALIEVAEGRCQRLVITVPPRHLKSICAAVALPAWLLGHDPGCRILVASYAQDLARKHSEDFRAILESDWYQTLFPRTRIAERGARIDEVRTTRRGFRKAVSLGGAATGFGADVLIIDDLLKAADATATSDTERARAKSYIEGTLLSRLDDKTNGKVIAIQQRLHEDDPVGYLLATGAYTHLNLPAIAETDEEIPLGGGRVHRRRKGEALFPQREPLETLERQRREMGSAAFNAQYQQNPIAPDGAILRWEWFGVYDDRPPRNWFQHVVQSWDLGMSDDPGSDPSVCTTWGFREKKWYLLDLLRDRLDYPELKRTVIRLHDEWVADRVVIEKAGSGIPLLQEIHREQSWRGWPFLPTLDKEVRFRAACARIEAGEVLLPRDAPWLEDFRHELMGFPNARHDDQVDSVSQFLNWLGGVGLRRMQARDPATGQRRRPSGRKRPSRR